MKIDDKWKKANGRLILELLDRQGTNEFHYLKEDELFKKNPKRKNPTCEKLETIILKITV